MQVTEAINGRRAVRDYKDQPVDKRTAAALIQAAIQAPNAINRQPCAFVVVQDKTRPTGYFDRAKVLCGETMHDQSGGLVGLVSLDDLLLLLSRELQNMAQGIKIESAIG